MWKEKRIGFSKKKIFYYFYRLHKSNFRRVFNHISKHLFLNELLCGY